VPGRTASAGCEVCLLLWEVVVVLVAVCAVAVKIVAMRGAVSAGQPTVWACVCWLHTLQRSCGHLQQLQRMPAAWHPSAWAGMLQQRVWGGVGQVCRAWGGSYTHSAGLVCDVCGGPVTVEDSARVRRLWAGVRSVLCCSR
jgi:hypothetical protein